MAPFDSSRTARIRSRSANKYYRYNCQTPIAVADDRYYWEMRGIEINSRGQEILGDYYLMVECPNIPAAELRNWELQMRRQRSINPSLMEPIEFITTPHNHPAFIIYPEQPFSRYRIVAKESKWMNYWVMSELYAFGCMTALEAGVKPAVLFIDEVNRKVMVDTAPTSPAHRSASIEWLYSYLMSQAIGAAVTKFDRFASAQQVFYLYHKINSQPASSAAPGRTAHPGSGTSARASGGYSISITPSPSQTKPPAPTPPTPPVPPKEPPSRPPQKKQERTAFSLSSLISRVSPMTPEKKQTPPAPPAPAAPAASTPKTKPLGHLYRYREDDLPTVGEEIDAFEIATRSRVIISRHDAGETQLRQAADEQKAHPPAGISGLSRLLSVHDADASFLLVRERLDANGFVQAGHEALLALPPDRQLKAAAKVLALLDDMAREGWYPSRFVEPSLLIRPDTLDVRFLDGHLLCREGSMPLTCTLGYAAPECYDDAYRVDPPGLHFALGVFLYRLFVGGYPMEGRKTVAALRAGGRSESQMAPELYGSEALFIFDPDDSGNGPDESFSLQAARFHALPAAIRDGFIHTFCTCLRDRREERWSFAKWRSVIDELIQKEG